MVTAPPSMVVIFLTGWKENVVNEDDQPLSLVQPVKEIEAPSLEVAHEEDDDTALSSFSPEVIEVINEEEEKVA